MAAYDTRSQYSPWAPASSVNSDHVCIALNMLALLTAEITEILFDATYLVLYSGL
jgi:hypothetical protein